MGKNIGKTVYDEKAKRKVILENITPSQALKTSLKGLYITLYGTFTNVGPDTEFLIEPISGRGNPKIYKVLDWKGTYFTIRGLNKKDKERVVCDGPLGSINKYYRELG